MRLVRESYAWIEDSPRPYSEIFYHRLFLEHPFTRALFPDDMTHQTFVFAKTIDALVDNIANIEQLGPGLALLAKKHVQYGVKPYQYAAVGTVLIDTFEEILGSRFTTEVRRAWQEVYEKTAGLMVAEAYPRQ